MWHEGKICIPVDGNEYKIVHYWVKVYKRRSKQYGIAGGKITKLMLKLDGEIICNYDRDWNIKPKCQEAEMVLSILLNNYN